MRRCAFRRRALSNSIVTVVLGEQRVVGEVVQGLVERAELLGDRRRETDDQEDDDADDVRHEEDPEQRAAETHGGAASCRVLVVRVQRDPARHHRAAAGCRRDVERAAERGDAVDHVAQARSGPALLGVEAGSVVAHREHELAGLLLEPDDDVRSRCVLRGVVQCLEAREVDGGLDLDRIARETFVLDGDLDRRDSPPGVGARLRVRAP